MYCTVEGRSGKRRLYVLPAEFIAPPVYLIIGGAIFAQEGTWTVPPKAGDRIDCLYKPNSNMWCVDISAVPFEAIGDEAAA